MDDVGHQDVEVASNIGFVNHDNYRKNWNITRTIFTKYRG